MPKIFKCQTCGLDKTLESHKKDGTTFMSCPNWKDQEHTKAREDYKRNQGRPQPTQNAPQARPSDLNATPDVYDLLTTLVANTNTILKILNKEMPNEEEY